MYRTHNCGELRSKNIGQSITLSGWVQRIRNLGGMTFIDLRDRYGITQLVADEGIDQKLAKIIGSLGREYVITCNGIVLERTSMNSKILTGDIEVQIQQIKILNQSELPPFTIEDETDGGDELRMKYRYLDIRRNPVRNSLLLRHKVAQTIRKYLDSQDFIEIETPFLIKSTPEGARDFVVPSRMHAGEFYALPQSPQTFKQLLMIAGMDKYFQIVKCFRDEDLRADRQPEFTQIDCEMSFVEQDDVLKTFEGMITSLFSEVADVNFKQPFQRMTYNDAMALYGSDKPDVRFEMCIRNLTAIAKGKGFGIFDNADYIGGIVATGCANYSRKQLDELTKFVQRPQVGAKGLIWIKIDSNGDVKSSVDKFYSSDDLLAWGEHMNAQKDDLMLVMAGENEPTHEALGVLRLEMADRLNLRDRGTFAPLWVVDFPLLEWDEETERFYAKHHPFTSPVSTDIHLFDSDPVAIRANAYDLVINGVEIGGGSIRISDRELQHKMFKVLGFTEAEAEEQFGFLLNAFKYGAPPHGGVAFGFDRLCAVIGGTDSIRDYIAFPKNNAGRDVMINTPSMLSQVQLNELSIEIKSKK
ncbi:MAG: aspartate--tRNA ligase [Bacteroidales bacterium]|nr:aspartate--tRNA ligase [Bacteroidales bacterium]MDD3891099.1 aspartate--tRNA ligase [Bacteroidales bacterium]